MKRALRHIQSAALSAVVVYAFMQRATAHDPLINKTMIVFATYDASIHRGTLYLVQHGIVQKLFQDDHLLTLPVLSPDHSKIAFNRVVDETIANADLVVVSKDGAVLSDVLVNDDPMHKLYEETRNIISLEWMNNSKVLMTGIFNPTVNIGYVIPIRSFVPARPRLYGSDPDDGMIYDEGPTSVSPSGLHVVSVSGLSQSTQYSRCGGGAKLAAGENLEIDGVDIKDRGTSFVVVSDLSWRDDQTFAAVVRQDDTVSVLTGRGVPQKFSFPRDDGTDSAPSNPPVLTFTPLEIGKTSAETSNFFGVFSKGDYWIEQFRASTGQAIASWLVPPSGAARQVSTESVPNTGSEQATIALRQSILAGLSGIAKAAGILATKIVSENVVCNNDVQCGPLADQPFRNSLVSGVKVPSVCQTR